MTSEKVQKKLFNLKFATIISLIISVALLLCEGAVLFGFLYFAQIMMTDGWNTTHISSYFEVFFICCVVLLPAEIPLAVSCILYRKQRPKSQEAQNYKWSFIASTVCLLVTISIGGIGIVGISQMRKSNREASCPGEKFDVAQPGLLIPAQDTIPKGYKEDYHCFHKNDYMLRFVNGAIDPYQLIIKEGEEGLDACTFGEGQHFSYNGSDGIVRTTIYGDNNSKVSYQLNVRDDNKCVDITWTELPIGQVQSDDVINVLKTFVLSK